LLRRTRWILVSLFAIYSYTTPGTPLWASLGGLSPVYEGVTEGAMQLLRLLASLAGLAILLSVLPQSQLVAGMFALSRPLALFRISSERFAVRLALTLRYAEGAKLDSGGGWYAGVESWLQAKSENRAGPELREILEMEIVSLTLIDLVIVAVTLLAIVGVWL
jgi:energy-coupling factor transport system permease protein